MELDDENSQPSDEEKKEKYDIDFEKEENINYKNEKIDEF